MMSGGGGGSRGGRRGRRRCTRAATTEVDDGGARESVRIIRAVGVDLKTINQTDNMKKDQTYID